MLYKESNKIFDKIEVEMSIQGALDELVNALTKQYRARGKEYDAGIDNHECKEDMDYLEARFEDVSDRLRQARKEAKKQDEYITMLMDKWTEQCQKESK